VAKPSDPIHEEMIRRADAKDAIAKLPENEQVAARANEERRKLKWKEEQDKVSARPLPVASAQPASASPLMKPSKLVKFREFLMKRL